jgi:hypothetical protein
MLGTRQSATLENLRAIVRSLMRSPAPPGGEDAYREQIAGELYIRDGSGGCRARSLPNRETDVVVRKLLPLAHTVD